MPAAPASDEASSTPAAPVDSRDVTSTQKFETTHILLVDAEAAFLKLAEMAFKRRGHKVSAFASPSQAMEILEREPVDIMVSELHFPDGGGYRLLEFVRARTALRRMPAIVLTKDRKARSKVRALEIGADDVLHKPCLLDELFVRVESTVKKCRELYRAAHAVRGDLAGRLGALPVADLFPLLQQRHQSGLLRLGEAGQELARVWWENGEVVAAEFGPLQGEEAVYALFPLRAGNFEFRGGEPAPGPRNVASGVTHLLLEGLRRLDETRTFQLIGGRPLPGPRGAHIEWFDEPAAGKSEEVPDTQAVRVRPDARAVQGLVDAFERCFRSTPAGTEVCFSDLRELRNLFRAPDNGALDVVRVVLACDLEEGLRTLAALVGPASPAQVRRGLRSGVELFPTAQVRLDERRRLSLLVAPLPELDVLVHSVPGAEAFYVAPPGGRWVAPEWQEGFKALLRNARPLACLPVGDGTVVEGLAGILRESGLEVTLAPVVERVGGSRLEITRALRRLLGALAPGGLSGTPVPVAPSGFGAPERAAP